MNWSELIEQAAGIKKDLHLLISEEPDVEALVHSFEDAVWDNDIESATIAINEAKKLL